PKAWMATKSHFCEAMLSMAARCLVALSSPSNQVTSTLKSLPQNSAACLPWAHQVACSPAFENAAFSGFSERPISAAAAALMRGSSPKPPSTAPAAPPDGPTLPMKSRRVPGGKLESIVICILPGGRCGKPGALRLERHWRVLNEGEWATPASSVGVRCVMSISHPKTKQAATHATRDRCCLDFVH